MNWDFHQPLKILMAIPRLQSGGAERQLGYLSRGLAELGHKIIVATLGDQGDPPADWCRHIRLHRLKGRSNYDPGLLFQLFRLIGKIKPDLIQTWNPQTDILGGAAAVMHSRPWLIREPSSADFYRTGWKSSVRARLGGRASGIVSNSAGGDAYWRSRHPDQPRRIIPNCIPLIAIRETPPALREEMELEANAKILLYAGRLSSEKGVGRVIDLVAALGDEIKTVALICGEGAEREKLKSRARCHGVESRVRFTGLLSPETVWGLMKTADCFLNLSDVEGMPNAVMEAMACGCSLLVSDIPAHREILDEKNASLVDPWDTKAQVAVLRGLLADPDSAGPHAVAVEKQIRSWSITAMAQQYESFYRDILLRSPRSPEEKS